MSLLRVSLLFFLYVASFTQVFGREYRKYNFNSDWLYHIGEGLDYKDTLFRDANWQKITLPRAFNEDEAFSVSIEKLTDTICWYRKHFRLPKGCNNKKIFVEFEGVRQGADFYLNGQHLGLHENGVMAVGLDLTPYIDYNKENILAVRIDNNWDYRERSSNSKYQWNNKNFNANYGGIPKNVWLHITDKMYQTLPLYSNLKTTGVYIYADQFDISHGKARIHAESQIRNEYEVPQKVTYEVVIKDKDNKTVHSFRSNEMTVLPQETTTIKADAEVSNLHFWSWGYGYLYRVYTRLLTNGKVTDEVITRTGFRKTEFKEGKVYLNDRVLQMKGYAQRTSNEWPAVGLSVPAWLSDYSNGLMVKSNGNFVRWMHVTPWKQDIESCDRVGLIQAMPAGDAEKDCSGYQWQQRTNLMRDAIIYNRNNPSILFYECGNESISREHMLEMKAIRNLYDPQGGRAIGSREMLDIRDAEYGGEMLYINKSMHHPMWAMEYARDEGLRKYWDSYSFPYHKEGEGPLYKNQPASDYNHNQDLFAVELVRRWFDYWRERPGTGTRVSSGGAKIVFSDTNTHYRGAENYRRSGVTDPMRIEKDAFFAHQVMWDGWVDVEKSHTHIIGHWNYESGTTKPVYVVSSGDSVVLFVNGQSKGKGKQDYRFLFSFDQVKWEPGVIEAVSYDKQGKEVSRDQIETVGTPTLIRLKKIESPSELHADGADMALIEVEVTDPQGRRCPLANDLIHFELKGPAVWRGGIAQNNDPTAKRGNYILSSDLPVECGVNRVLIRSTTHPGKITLTATATGLKSSKLSFSSSKVKIMDGLSEWIPGEELPVSLVRGETPKGESFKATKQMVPIISAESGIQSGIEGLSYDDNELTEWRNDGKLSTAWITYRLSRKSIIDEVCLKLTGWRMRSYPIEVYADKELIWSGETEKSLGYIHLSVKPVSAQTMTIRLKGTTSTSDAFGQITELASPKELDMYKIQGSENTGNELRIVEIEFLESINKEKTAAL